MIKYASNAFLAAKISFINELANICERLPLKVDIVDVALAVGMDPRIGSDFLNAGVGWGGSCFPKDTVALATFSRKLGYRPKMLTDVIRVNFEQAKRVVNVVKEELGNLKDKKIAILGLSFKPGTDDVRGAASIRIINHLIQEGAHVNAYDPVAIGNAKKVLGTKIDYSPTVAKCLGKADCCILVTEWEEFKKLSPEDFIRLMRTPFLFDGRRIYDPAEFSRKLRFRAIGLSKTRDTQLLEKS
jgi:UDPglucose 6-dehydrogenase